MSQYTHAAYAIPHIPLPQREYKRISGNSGPMNMPTPTKLKHATNAYFCVLHLKLYGMYLLDTSSATYREERKGEAIEFCSPHPDSRDLCCNRQYISTYISTAIFFFDRDITPLLAPALLPGLPAPTPSLWHTWKTQKPFDCCRSD